MLARFQDVYRFAIPIHEQPIDRTLSVVRHLRAKRSFEFDPSSVAAAYSEKESPCVAAQKKIIGTDVHYAPNALAGK